MFIHQQSLGDGDVNIVEVQNTFSNRLWQTNSLHVWFSLSLNGKGLKSKEFSHIGSSAFWNFPFSPQKEGQVLFQWGFSVLLVVWLFFGGGWVIHPCSPLFLMFHLFFLQIFNIHPFFDFSSPRKHLSFFSTPGPNDNDDTKQRQRSPWPPPVAIQRCWANSRDLVRWVDCSNLREPQHTPASHTPGIPPQKKKQMTKRIPKHKLFVELRVWGMFQGYVGKFLEASRQWSIYIYHISSSWIMSHVVMKIEKLWNHQLQYLGNLL